MNKKNKYQIERWDYDKPLHHSYSKFTIEGIPELIHWKRILKSEKRTGAINDYKITKIE